MQLWLTPDTQPDTRVAPPAACPHAGCAGRRFRLLQRVAKPVRDAAPRSVVAGRYACRSCGRTFRVYPPGVDRGDVAVSVKRFAVALRLAGLSLRDVSRALAVFGAPLGKSQVQAVVAPRLKGLRHRSIEPLLERVLLQPRLADAADGSIEASVDAGQEHVRHGAPPRATVVIGGRGLTLRRAVDKHGRVALVVDGVDRRTRLAVAQWAEATLAGLGVRVEVVSGVPSRRRAAVDVVDEAVGAIDVDAVASVDDNAVASSDDGAADAGMRVSAAVDTPLEVGSVHGLRDHGPVHPSTAWRSWPALQARPWATTPRRGPQRGRGSGDSRSWSSLGSARHPWQRDARRSGDGMTSAHP